MWFSLNECELGFCEASPFQIKNEVLLDCDAPTAFSLLAEDRHLEAWLEGCKRARWTSELPRGVGSTREVVLDTIAVREKFVAWEPGVRMTFTGTEISAPLTRRVMEDFRFESLGPNATRFLWTLHYEPRLFMRPIHPIVRAVFRRLFKRSLDRLVVIAKEHGARVVG